MEILARKITEGSDAEVTTLANILEIFQDKSVIAGGSVLYLTKGVETYDVDIFVSDKDLIVSYIKMLLGSYPDLEIIGNEIRAYSCPVLNVNIGYKMEIQFIYTEYSDVHDLVETFDMDYVQCGIQNGTIYRTDACVAAHEAGYSLKCAKNTQDTRLYRASSKGYFLIRQDPCPWIPLNPTQDEADKRTILFPTTGGATIEDIIADLRKIKRSKRELVDIYPAVATRVKQLGKVSYYKKCQGKYIFTRITYNLTNLDRNLTSDFVYVNLEGGAEIMEERQNYTLYRVSPIYIGDIQVSTLVAKIDPYCTRMPLHFDKLPIIGKLVFSYIGGKMEPHIKLTNIISCKLRTRPEIQYCGQVDVDIQGFMEDIGYKQVRVKSARM